MPSSRAHDQRSSIPRRCFQPVVRKTEAGSSDEAGEQPLSSRPVLRSAEGETIGWQCGHVLGVYLHGLFESSAVMQALFGAQTRTLDESLDGLADLMARHFARDTLRLLGSDAVA